MPRTKFLKYFSVRRRLQNRVLQQHKGLTLSDVTSVHCAVMWLNPFVRLLYETVNPPQFGDDFIFVEECVRFIAHRACMAALKAAFQKQLHCNPSFRNCFYDLDMGLCYSNSPNIGAIITITKLSSTVSSYYSI